MTMTCPYMTKRQTRLWQSLGKIEATFIPTLPWLGWPRPYLWDVIDPFE